MNADERRSKDLEFSYEPYPKDVIAIEGVKYAGDFFRNFSSLVPVGEVLQIVARKDGTVVVRRLGTAVAGASLDRLWELSDQFPRDSFRFWLVHSFYNLAKDIFCLLKIRRL